MSPRFFTSLTIWFSTKIKEREASRQNPGNFKMAAKMFSQAHFFHFTGTWVDHASQIWSRNYVSLSTSLAQSSSMSMSMYSPKPFSSPVSCFHFVTWWELFVDCELDLLPPWLVLASSSCCILLCFVRLFWNQTLTCKEE